MSFFKGLIIFINVLVFFLIIIWVYNPNNSEKIEKSSKIPFLFDDFNNK